MSTPSLGWPFASIGIYAGVLILCSSRSAPWVGFPWIAIVSGVLFGLGRLTDRYGARVWGIVGAVFALLFLAAIMWTSKRAAHYPDGPRLFGLFCGLFGGAIYYCILSIPFVATHAAARRALSPHGSLLHAVERRRIYLTALVALDALLLLVCAISMDSRAQVSIVFGLWFFSRAAFVAADIHAASRIRALWARTERIALTDGVCVDPSLPHTLFGCGDALRAIVTPTTDPYRSAPRAIAIVIGDGAQTLMRMREIRRVQFKLIAITSVPAWFAWCALFRACT